MKILIPICAILLSISIHAHSDVALPESSKWEAQRMLKELLAPNGENSTSAYYKGVTPSGDACTMIVAYDRCFFRSAAEPCYRGYALSVARGDIEPGNGYRGLGFVVDENRPTSVYYQSYLNSLSRDSRKFIMEFNDEVNSRPWHIHFEITIKSGKASTATIYSMLDPSLNRVCDLQ